MLCERLARAEPYMASLAGIMLEDNERVLQDLRHVDLNAAGASARASPR